MKKPKRKISPQVLAVKKQYKDCLVTLLFAFINGLLIMVVLSLPIGLILGETSDLANSLTVLLGTLVTIFVSSYKKGYYYSQFKFSQLLLGIVLTFVTQVFLSSIGLLIFTGHSAWFSGPAMFWGSYLFKVKYPDVIITSAHKEIIEYYRWIFVVLLFWFAYAPLMIFGKYLGVKKGIRNSEINKEEKTREKTINEHPFDM